MHSSSHQKRIGLKSTLACANGEYFEVGCGCTVFKLRNFCAKLGGTAGSEGLQRPLTRCSLLLHLRLSLAEINNPTSQPTLLLRADTTPCSGNFWPSLCRGFGEAVGKRKRNPCHARPGWVAATAGQFHQPFWRSNALIYWMLQSERKSHSNFGEGILEPKCVVTSTINDLCTPSLPKALCIKYLKPSPSI